MYALNMYENKYIQIARNEFGTVGFINIFARL